MNIVDLIKRDHDEAKELMETIALERDPAQAMESFGELKTALTAHAQAEQEVLYPAMKVIDETRELTLEAYEEHALAMQLMDELEQEDASSETWRAKFMVLKTNVEHHVREEEKELLPKAKRLLPKDEMSTLAEDFEEARARYEGVAVGA